MIRNHKLIHFTVDLMNVTCHSCYLFLRPFGINLMIMTCVMPISEKYFMHSNAIHGAFPSSPSTARLIRKKSERDKMSQKIFLLINWTRIWKKFWWRNLHNLNCLSLSHLIIFSASCCYCLKMKLMSIKKIGSTNFFSQKLFPINLCKLIHIQVEIFQFRFF